MKQAAGRLVYVILGVVLVAALLGYFDAREARVDQAILDQLRELGFREGRIAEPTIPDLPPTVKPVIVVETVIEPTPFSFPVAPAPNCGIGEMAEIPAGVYRPPALESPNWTLKPDNLGLEYRFEVVRAGRTPFGRLFGTILAETPHGRVERPLDAELDISDLTVSPDALPGRLSLDLFATADSVPQVEIGALWRRPASRRGFLVTAGRDLDAGAWTLGAGVAIHVGRR